MPKLYDVVKAAGTYRDRNGQEKTRWINCGMIVQNPESGRMSLKLDCIPVGTPTDGDVGIWFSLFDPNQQQKNQRQNLPPQSPQPYSGQQSVPSGFAPPQQEQPEDDIPF